MRSAFQRHFSDGEIIFDEGDEGLDLYFIQAGRVEIRRSGIAGPRVVATLEPGDFFGEMSVVLGETRTGRAVAVGETELLELDGETLEGMCVERPEIAIRMIQRLAQRLIGAERRLAALGLDELVSPLVRYLASQGTPDDEAVRLRTNLRELAAGCELSMHETHQALHKLMDQKLVRLIDDELIAPDRAALSTAMIKPLDTTPNLTERVYNAIVDEILDGTLKPGQHLIQEQLAAELGVSRQPIQQAMALLRADGLVEETGRRGMTVTTLDVDRMRHHYEIRAVLDGFGARQAAGLCARDAGRARVFWMEAEVILTGGFTSVTAGHSSDQIRHDEMFHEMIYTRSGNPVLADTAGPNWRFLRRAMGDVLRHAAPPAAIWEEHQQSQRQSPTGMQSSPSGLPRTTSGTRPNNSPRPWPNGARRKWPDEYPFPRGQMLAGHARLRPDAPAVHDLDRSMTFAQWNRRACRLANALTGLGLSRGDRVAVLAYNRIEWAEIYCAAAKAGLVVVPINFRLTAPETAFILGDSGADALIVEDALTGTVEAGASACRSPPTATSTSAPRRRPATTPTRTCWPTRPTPSRRPSSPPTTRGACSTRRGPPAAPRAPSARIAAWP